MKISVTTPAGKTYTARYITGDEDHDLAMIKVDATEKFPFIALNDLSPNLLGQTCLVLGNPLGYGSSVARGILSAKGRSVTVGEVEYQNCRLPLPESRSSRFSEFLTWGALPSCRW